MIDFHSHILPDIDDGSRSLEESIKIVEEAKSVGFNKIISTSHYIERYYESDKEKRTELLEQLKSNITDVELFLGNEIYITYDIIKLIEEGKASTINDSRYILFELPLNTKPMNAEEVVYRIIEKGGIPVIAHPERYSYVQNDIKFAEKLFDMGALFQSNYGSIIGMYGSKAKKTVKKLLKQDMVHFLGSDVHRTNQIYPKIPQIMKKLKRIVSERKIEELTELNAEKVLKDEDIE